MNVFYKIICRVLGHKDEESLMYDMGGGEYTTRKRCHRCGRVELSKAYRLPWMNEQARRRALRTRKKS